MAPNTPKLTDQVRTIGRKVRARLDEEVKNRREIQRVEPSAQSHEGNPKVVIEIPKPSKPAAKPRKRKLKPQQELGDDTNIDRWMPIIDHLPELNEGRSSLVQLHGLPVGVTAAQVRRFFSGLRIQRLVVFPRFDSTIQELDAVPAPGKKPAVARYGASMLRSFVKFESAPTAASAVQRSGEILKLDDAIGVAVRLSGISKSHANVLLNTLAMDCSLQNTQPIYEVVEHVKVGATVSRILWTEVIHTLQFVPTAEPSQQEAMTFLVFPRHEKVSFQLSSAQVEWLRERRDLLGNFVSQLRDQLPWPSADCVDPTVEDPLLRLNTKCSEILQREIDRVDQHLLVVSKWRVLMSTSAESKD